MKQRRPLWILLAAAITIGSVAGYAFGPWRGPSGPNVVLISIDSLRADHLGCYGYPRETTPFLDQLAAAGIVFEDAVSSSSWTIPSHAALFTGLPDRVHGCVDEASWLPADRRTIAEAFRESGYRTVGFFSGPPLHPSFGFGQGFDHYHDCTTLSETSIAVLKGEQEVSAFQNKPNTVITNGEVLAAVEQWVATAPDRPFFAFIHLWDVHYDYIPPAPYDRHFDPDYDGPCDGRDVLSLATRPEHWTERDVAHLRARYDGEIRWTDETVRKILERIEARFGGRDLLVAVTSDHGEAFYEHGVHGHRMSLFEEEIRVPLILRYPPLEDGGRRIRDPVSLMDLAPTLLALAGVRNGLPDAYGRNLAAGLRGTAPFPPEKPAVCELIDRQKDLHLFAVRTSRWKMILDLGRSRTHLYDLQRDPGETRAIEERDDPVIAAEVARVFREVQRELTDLGRRVAPPRTRDTPPISEMTEQQLRSLGYLK